MYSEINSIKSVAKARKIFNTLSAELVSMVGEKQAMHSDKMFRIGSGMSLTENGLAWWKARIRAVAYDISHKASASQHFIPPSPETLAWGGFLGGETLYMRDKQAEIIAENKIIQIVKG